MMQAHWLGQSPYLETLEVFNHLEGPAVLGSESPTCITLGRRSSEAASETREDCPPIIPVYRVDRGGHATLHNLGQLIIYPKLHLQSHNMSVRDYVCQMGITTVAVLNELGLQTRAVVNSSEGEPGIYTSQGKIGFLGVRISKGITSHGLSLNVSNDLSDFRFVRSCSVWNQPVDSLQKHGVSITTEELFFRWKAAFSAGLGLTPKCPTTNVRAGDFKPLRV